MRNRKFRSIVVLALLLQGSTQASRLQAGGLVGMDSGVLAMNSGMMSLGKEPETPEETAAAMAALE